MLGEQYTTETAREAGRSRTAAAELVLRWVHPRLREPTLLGRRRLTLGRTRDSDVQLEGREVSRCHAEVLPLGERFALRDLGSRNGTYVDGERVQVRELSPGQIVRAGEWVAVVDELVPGEGVDDPAGIHATVWTGPKLRRTLRALEELAKNNLPILVYGETGTGKDLLARLVHSWSGRTGAFSVVDCASLPPTLAEASLFGYTRGAFTGALRDEVGLLRQADAGTVYLDELGDLPSNLQGKLLRFADTGEVTPVGTSKPSTVDTRIVASVRAVNGRPLGEAIRDDLLARLQGATITLPALRERLADVPGLLDFFLREALGGRGPSFDAEFVESLCLESWPGNVRDVRNVARQLALRFGREPVLSREHLRAALAQFRPRNVEPSSPETLVGVESERDRESREVGRLREYFRSGRSVVTEAADILGVGRQRIYALLDRHPELAKLRAEATGTSASREDRGSTT